MSKPSIRVEFNPARLMASFDDQKHRAQVFLDESVMKDTDKFVMFRSGMLARSVRTATTPGSGRVVYDTPYARRRYYEDHVQVNRGTHPQATPGWFEVSKARYIESWRRGVEKILKERR